MKKRISLLLAVVLLFSCLPWTATPAAAAPEEKSPADDCKILDYVHEEVFTEGDHLGRMEEEETLSSYVFLNKDGTRTAYYLDEAVKFVDSDGKIKEKDITLQSVLGGYATTQNDVTVTLPITRSSGVNLSYKNYQISLVPEGSTASAAEIINNAAVYSDFYGADTALKYTPTLSGVKEDIILESYTGQNTFTFILNTNGLAVYHTKEDRYYLAPGKGADPVYWLGALEIYDSALNMGDGNMTVDTLMTGQKYKITITVDETWLTAKGRVYPVTVDPSITVSDNTSAGSVVDAPVYSDYPSRNYGTNIYDCAGHMNGYGEGRTAIYLSGLKSNSSYNNLSASQLLSVTFYIADASGSSADTIYLYPLSGNLSWTESNVTYNNVGSLWNTAYASKKRSGGNYSALDITVLAQKWKTGAFNSNYHFVLCGSNTTSGNDALYSSEHSTTGRRPYVEVTYEGSALHSNSSKDGYFVNSVHPLDSELICDDGLRFRSNCYGYAFRFYASGSLSNNSDEITIGDYIYKIYKQQPGEFADKTNGLHINEQYNGHSVNKIIEDYNGLSLFLAQYVTGGDSDDRLKLHCLYALLEADADAEGLNYTITPINDDDGVIDPAVDTIPSVDYSEGRLIAVVIGGGDYHFYMQNSDTDDAGNNIWTHKPGEDEPRNYCLCCTDVVLTNDNIAEHANHGRYTGGIVSFFYISKTTYDTAHSCAHNLTSIITQITE